VFSAQNKKENTFLEIKPNFSLIGKYFSLTNFSNSKQTQESLKNKFLKITFQENKHIPPKNKKKIFLLLPKLIFIYYYCLNCLTLTPYPLLYYMENFVPSFHDLPR